MLKRFGRAALIGRTTMSASDQRALLSQLLDALQRPLTIGKGRGLLRGPAWAVLAAYWMRLVTGLLILAAAAAAQNLAPGAVQHATAAAKAFLFAP